ncbi:SIR2 family protein [Actinomarinicola tropica]|uniref:Uncharacterized protein n=1 Tax=Actinomarinicola tropica TaxID=2789776 RepID=A0A5Q2RIZ1_9ACTN|nr:SIR2 family protein [Actinomarinicola tropica]QGG94356.1 hypothetical protein GH723_04140 [Actinomarinicola tropica]
MPGHLFITHGDLRHLACDAILVPSGAAPRGRDPRPHVAKHWRKVLPVEALDGPYLRQSFARNRSTRQLTSTRSAAGPTIWVGDTARDRDQSAADLAEVVAEFIQRASAQATNPERPRPLDHRRPLVAFPLVGTGDGFHSQSKGDVVKAVVQRALGAVKTHDVDAVLVAYDPAAYAAAQQARSRYARPPLQLLPAAQATFDRVRDEARDGRLVLFLGAGASMGAGLPSWRTLVNGLIEETLGPDRPSDSQLGRMDVRDIATLIEKSGQPKGFRDLIVDQIAVGPRETPRVSLLHQLMASLPAHEAVTTNYDTLFETAWSDTGRTPTILPRDGQVLSRDWLLKLHGSVDDKERIVLSRGDYLRFEREASALAGLVHAALLTRHLLFVGYSLSDDNFHRIVHQVRDLQPVDQKGATNVLGTVFTPDEPTVMQQLWKPELPILSTHRKRLRASSAVRDQAILLDRLAAEASPPGRHLLDESYDAVFNEGERQLRTAIDDLLTLVEAERVAGKVIRPALRAEVRSALERFQSQTPTTKSS